MSNEYIPAVERFVTIRRAAEILGIHYWQLLRLVKTGSVPAYHVGNARKRVRISEIVAFIEATRDGSAE